MLTGCMGRETCRLTRTASRSNGEWRARSRGWGPRSVCLIGLSGRLVLYFLERCSPTSHPAFPANEEGNKLWGTRLHLSDGTSLIGSVHSALARPARYLYRARDRQSLT